MDEYTILKKKRKKNGFASTALLISIAIALIAMIGAVVLLNRADTQNVVTADENSTVEELTKSSSTSDDETCEGFNKEVVFNENLRTIKEAAISYFTNERLPQSVGDTVKMSLAAMQEKKLLLNVRDASGKTCSSKNSYVEITKDENEYVMKIFLSCGDMEDYILVHLGCYDYCDKDVCEKKEKTYEYEYRKTTDCVMGEWSNWGPWQTKREKTSAYKKEDIKVETTSQDVSDTKDATKTVTYNCDKYPGYKLVGNKCVKETKITDVQDATPSKYSYNCDKYPGYDLVGSKCIKETTKTDTKNADVTYNCDGYSGYTLQDDKCVKSTTDTKNADVTYNCDKYSGYTLKDKKCTKTTTDTKDANVTYNCKKYSGYSLDGKKCKKTTTTTDTKEATPVYGSRSVASTCYKKQCTTKMVFQCPSGKTCGDYPQTSCEYVSYTCYVSEEYITGYSCPSDYSQNGTTCTKTITTTDTKDATKVYDCSKLSGYTLDGSKCKKTTTDTKDATAVYNCKNYPGYTLSDKVCKKTTTDTKDAKKDYNCKKYSGYTLDGTKCKKTTTTKDEKDATKVPGGYVCPDGYTQNDKTCTRVVIKVEEKTPDSKTVYSCPKGYTSSGTKCYKSGTQTIKKTFYRYATRSCTGGSTEYEWSTSKNDSILLSEGYKLTGKKRELIVK